MPGRMTPIKIGMHRNQYTVSEFLHHTDTHEKYRQFGILTASGFGYRLPVILLKNGMIALHENGRITATFFGDGDKHD